MHLVAGNPSKLPKERLRDSTAVEVEIPSCPRHLNKAARTEWRRITKELARYGLITTLDRSTLAAYCQTYSRWVAAETKIKALSIEDPGGEGLITTAPKTQYQQINVWLQISNKALELMKHYIREFGLSPSARAGFDIQALGSGKPKEDPAGDKEKPKKPANQYFD